MPCVGRWVREKLKVMAHFKCLHPQPFRIYNPFTENMGNLGNYAPA